MERSPMLVDQQNQYCENSYTIKSNLHIQCNPHQNSNDISSRDRKINPKVNIGVPKTLNSQDNSEQKEQPWRYHNA
jgi:hypothetical protein